MLSSLARTRSTLACVNARVLASSVTAFSRSRIYGGVDARKLNTNVESPLKISADDETPRIMITGCMYIFLLDMHECEGKGE